MRGGVWSAAVLALVAGCGGSGRWGWSPLPADSSCYDDLQVYDRGATAHYCMGGDVNRELTESELRLRRLVVCDSRFEGLGGLERQTGLEHLVLYELEALPPLAALGARPGLTHLDLTAAPLEEWGFLRNFPGLRVLLLRHTTLADLAPLAGLAALEELDLTGTPVSDLTPLRGLARLRVLKLGGTQVRDLQPLALLAGLQELWLDGLPISDLAPLAGLRELRVLQLEGTQVSDLRPLHGLGRLRAVGVLGAPVSFEESQALEQAVNGPERGEGERLTVNIAGLQANHPYCPINRWRDE